MFRDVFTDPVIWVIIMAAIVTWNWLSKRGRSQPLQEPPLTEEPKIRPPKIEPEVNVGENDPLRPHLFELIAAAVNDSAAVKWWNLKDLRAGTTMLGNWRITVEKIED